MPLSAKTIPVPGHPSPTLDPLHVLERDGLRNTILRLSLHTATHIDAPSHFIENGTTIDQVPLDLFHRPAVRIDLSSLARPRQPIGSNDLGRAGFHPAEAHGNILLLATGWTDRSWKTEDLYKENPHLSPDAAEAVAAAAPSALGLDFAVDSGRPWPNHTVLLGAGIPLIENLMGLTALPPDGFHVLAFPLRIVGENGAPARVVGVLP
jgi:kynurenine formamidase